MLSRRQSRSSLTTAPASAARPGKPPSLVRIRCCATSAPASACHTNGVIERFFGTLKHEHTYRAPIDDGGALAMETTRFRDLQPHPTPTKQSTIGRRAMLTSAPP